VDGFYRDGEEGGRQGERGGGSHPLRRRERKGRGKKKKRKRKRRRRRRRRRREEGILWRFEPEDCLVVLVGAASGVPQRVVLEQARRGRFPVDKGRWRGRTERHLCIILSIFTNLLTDNPDARAAE